MKTDEPKDVAEPSPVSAGSALALAIRFHEAYERLAPRFGYETRPETRNFDPQSQNGRLMVAVCREIIEQNEIARLRITDAEREALAWAIFEFDSLRPDNGKAFERAATLRGFLERHRKGGEA